MEGVYDGLVSKHINRRISRPIARVLSHTPITPNQVSFVSLGVALSSFFLFVYDFHIIAALMAQASSIVDGVDGDLARAKKMTSAFGGFMDSILDRYADALIILGLAIWAAGDGRETYVWIVGFWALAGTFVVTYTRARIDDAPTHFDKGIPSLASRDIRLFIIMIGALTGQGFATLVVIATLTNVVVIIRLVLARKVLGQASS